MNKTEMGGSSCSSISITGLQNSGSESDLRQQDLIDERKRKRKQSNRESARRSRLRKQKHLDDLASQVTNLRRQNSQLVAGIALRNQHYVAIESENSILRAQLLELNRRLDSLTEIVDFVESSSEFGIETGHGGLIDGGGGGGGGGLGYFDGVMNHMNLGFYNQPIMSSAATTGDVFNC